MTLSFSKYFRFGIPDFASGPWHAEFAALVHQIDAALFSGVITAGGSLWANGTVYSPGDVVIDAQTGTLWTCAVAHTSPALPTTFAQYRVANPTHWLGITTPLASQVSITPIGTIVSSNVQGALAELASANIVQVTSSAFGTDNRALRSNGTGRGAQSSLVDIDDSGNITTPGNIVDASLSGIPVAPTAIPGTNNSQVATTGYTDAAATLVANDAASALATAIDAVDARSGIIIVGTATGVNFNAVADTTINIVLPTGFTKWRPQLMAIYNASAPLNVGPAQFGYFTAAGGGGVTIIAATPCTVSTIAVDTLNNAQYVGIPTAIALNDLVTHFRVTTANGAAGTGTVIIFGQPLP